MIVFFSLTFLTRFFKLFYFLSLSLFFHSQASVLKLCVALLLANSFSYGSSLNGRLTVVNEKPVVVVTPYTSDDSPEELTKAKDYSLKSLSERQHGEEQDDLLNLLKKEERFARGFSICHLINQAIECIGDDNEKRQLCSLPGKCQYRLVFLRNRPTMQCV